MIDHTPDADEGASRRDAHFIHSALRESIVEHVFMGEVLRCLWRSKVYDVEVLRSEVDSAGYDLVISCRRSEMRIYYGPGYRVYFVRRDNALVILLCGGDKATQSKDIRSAKALAVNLED